MPERAHEKGVDRVRSLVRGYARACLNDLHAIDEPPRPEAGIESADGWTVLTLAFPTPPGEGLTGLTECDRDCLALLSQTSMPLSGGAVRRELESRCIGIHGLTTVKRSLTRLKRLGLLRGSKRSPVGYSLAGDLPLYRKV
jgi:hypothetical protein